MHRILVELAGWDVVERVPGGWRLGLRLFELGHLVPAQRDLVEAATPFLTDLSASTRYTVHLAVPDGVEVLYLHKLPGSHAPAIPSRVGGRMPMYCTGVGKAVLAFSPPAVVDAVLAAGLVRRTPRTVVAPGILARDLYRVRDRGTAEDHEESALGVACVAAPVAGARSHPIAAVSVTGWTNRLDTERLAPAVRAAARGIARAMR